MQIFHFNVQTHENKIPIIGKTPFSKKSVSANPGPQNAPFPPQPIVKIKGVTSTITPNPLIWTITVLPTYCSKAKSKTKSALTPHSRTHFTMPASETNAMATYPEASLSRATHQAQQVLKEQVTFVEVYEIQKNSETHSKEL